MATAAALVAQHARIPLGTWQTPQGQFVPVLITREWLKTITLLSNAADASGTVTSVSGTGTVDISIAVATPTSTPAISLALLPTTVVAGTYSLASITVDTKGRITGASNGTSGVTGVTATSPVVSSGGTAPDISLLGLSGLGTALQVVRVNAAATALEYAAATAGAVDYIAIQSFGP